ncbi:type VI secretion protein, partial [Xanthomonas citri pv. citri]|nr:type VI secretion protein [Xanthomonas citri pv. citri]
LDGAVGLLKKAFVNLGVKPVREWFAMETFFWAQLPGQAQHFMGRRGKIKSGNFAGFASLHNFAVGKIDGNLWGPAIMPFETESGTAYYFSFHREMEGMVAGHTAFTADTGAGKTTLLAALIAMGDKAYPRVFWFDNREGAKVFMCAMGGQHTTLTVQGSTGWNPMKLPDTPENRAYLVELLTLMRTCYGGKIVPDDIDRFKKAVHENYALAYPDRRLLNVAWCFGQGELAKDMRVWHGANGIEGANWGVFDNEHDNIDLTNCRHYCYEMRQLIKDGTARPELPVVLSYPFHRIEQSMNGEPFILVLEEGQNLVKHAYWREKIDSYI